MKLLGFFDGAAFIYNIPDDVVNEYPARILTGDMFALHVEKNDIVVGASSTSKEYRQKKQILNSDMGCR